MIGVAPRPGTRLHLPRCRCPPRALPSQQLQPGEQGPARKRLKRHDSVVRDHGGCAQSAGDSAEPSPDSYNPYAVELFQRDWVLNQWAKRTFDTNGDGAISAQEAQPAAR